MSVHLVHHTAPVVSLKTLSGFDMWVRDEETESKADIAGDCIGGRCLALETSSGCRSHGVNLIIYNLSLLMARWTKNR